MHTVAEVLALLAQHVHPLPPQSLPLSQALRLRLAQPIHMDIDSPPFDRSLVDGYALRAADALPAARLHILGRQDAGAPTALAVSPGTCIAINTGAPIPPGADAVIMVEDTTPTLPSSSSLKPQAPSLRAQDSGDIEIHPTRPLTPGSGIQPRASDAQSGHQVLSPGTLLRPAQLAVAAAAGCASVSVYPQPTVALFATGDELVPHTQLPGPAQIRNTNSLLLESLAQQSHAKILLSESLSDDPTLLRARLAAALASADLLIITGGMSMGTRDLIPNILTDLGMITYVQKVRIKPGKPFLFGTYTPPPLPSPTQSPNRKSKGGQNSILLSLKPQASTYVLGLPGNPVSAFVCFHRFARELLHRLAGGTSTLPLQAAITTADLPANTDREFYQPARYTLPVTNGHRPTVAPLPWQGSADLFTLAQANALIIHPINQPPRPSGTPVDILLL